MKMLGLLIWLVAGAVQAAQTDETFLVTGTITENMWGAPETGTLQFQYTIDPLLNPEQDPTQLGPITSMAYSINGGAFQPDNGWGTVDVNSGSFILYHGSGTQISYDASHGTMVLFDHDLNGEIANVTSVERGGGAQTFSAQAPEIDPAGWVSGLTLLIGGLLVLRGRRLLRHDLVDRGGLRC